MPHTLGGSAIELQTYSTDGSMARNNPATKAQAIPPAPPCRASSSGDRLNMNDLEVCRQARAAQAAYSEGDLQSQVGDVLAVGGESVERLFRVRHRTWRDRGGKPQSSAWKCASHVCCLSPLQLKAGGWCTVICSETSMLRVLECDPPISSEDRTAWIDSLSIDPAYAEILRTWQVLLLNALCACVVCVPHAQLSFLLSQGKCSRMLQFFVNVHLLPHQCLWRILGSRRLIEGQYRDPPLKRTTMECFVFRY